MRNYEMFLILKPKADETASQKAVRDIEAVLNKYGAKLKSSHSGGNARLAYPIQKRTDSFQIILDIEAEAQGIKELKKQLALVDDVLRATIFTKTPVAA